MSDVASAASLSILLAKSDIYDVQMRYCRGIDRCDADLIRSAYWPEAVDHHGIFDGNAYDFAEFVVPHMHRALRSTHMICNMYVTLSGENEAQAESYVLSYSERDGPDGLVEALQGGRYLDRFERRGAEWKIIERTYVMDWNMNGPSTADWVNGTYGKLTIRGDRGDKDPSWMLVPALAGWRDRHVNP